MVNPTNSYERMRLRTFRRRAALNRRRRRTLRRMIRRAAASLLTFVLVSFFAAWSFCVVQGVGLYMDERTQRYGFKRYSSESSYSDEAVTVSSLLVFPLICGVVAGASLWVPTAPKHYPRRRR